MPESCLNSKLIFAKPFTHLLGTIRTTVAELFEKRSGTEKFVILPFALVTAGLSIAISSPNSSAWRSPAQITKDIVIRSLRQKYFILARFQRDYFQSQFSLLRTLFVTL